MAGVTAHWNLRLAAIFEGPDVLTDAAVYEGRRFVGAESPGVYHSLQVNHPAVSARVGIDGQGIEVLGAENLEAVFWQLTDYYRTLENADAVDYRSRIYQVTRRPQGCTAVELTSIEEAVPGHLWIQGLTEATTLGLHVWYDDTCPAHGAAIWEIIDGELTDTGPEGMDECYALQVLDGDLYAAGRYAGENRYGLWVYDGSTWVEWGEVEGKPTDLWVSSENLYLGTSLGAYRVAYYGVEAIVSGYVRSGFDVAGWAACLQGDRLSDERGRQILASVDGNYSCESLAGKGFVATSGLSGRSLCRIDFPGARLIDRVRWTGDQPVALVRYRNRLFACDDDGEGQPRVLGFDGSVAEFAEGQIWRVDRGQSGDPMIAIGRLLQDLHGTWDGVGQVVLETTDQVMLYDISHECADGTGDSPVLDEIRHECAEAKTPVRLDAVGHECADGNGDSPELGSVEHECMTWDGTGDSPELGSVEHECSGNPGVILDDLAHECKDGAAGPGVGEAIVFITATLDSQVRQMRIVTSEPLSADWRAICRIDREALDVDAWESYEAAPLNANWTPAQEGTEVRVGIIGPWGEGREPGVCVNFLRE